MAEGLNKVLLIGNLGQDPELRYTQGGHAVLNLRLATTETFVNRDRERQQRTEWHTVVVWGKRGEALNKILSKGRNIYVEGRLQTRKWEDRDGNRRFGVEVVATNVILLGGRPSGSAPADYSPYDDHAPAADRGAADDFESSPVSGGDDRGDLGDDDIPF